MVQHKKSLADVPEEFVHDGTTHRKQLIRVDDSKQGDIATMNYAWLDPGKQLAAHTHPDGEEYYLFLEGTGDILVGDDWLPVTGGDFITIPVQTAHSVKNSGDARLVFLTVRTVQKAL